MKYTSKMIFVVILLGLGCKKQENVSPKVVEIASKYGLVKTAYKPGAAVTKSFETLEDLEYYLKGKPSSIFDSLTIKASKRSILVHSGTIGTSGQPKFMNSDIEGPESTEWIKYYTFPAFTGEYPDKVMVMQISPYNHMLMQSGPTLGSWSYAPFPGRFGLTDGTYDGWRYSGIYTETYSAAGIFSWYRHWQFTLDVFQRPWGNELYASYIENPS